MSAFSVDEFSLLGPLTGPTSNPEPTIQNMVSSVVGLFDLVGNTAKEKVEPPMRTQMVVTKGNYRELALAEIARQNTEFGHEFPGNKIPVEKQAAILTAFQRLAGIDAGVSQETLDKLQETQDRLSLKGQIGEFGQRAADFAEDSFDTVQNVVEFATSPFGLLGGVAVITVIAFLFLR